jgi:hypothetical protein
MTWPIRAAPEVNSPLACSGTSRKHDMAGQQAKIITALSNALAQCTANQPNQPSTHAHAVARLANPELARYLRA